MKNIKKPTIIYFDLKNSGIFLFKLIGNANLSNNEPWGQTFPHQNLPEKKEVIVIPNITKITSKPNFGTQRPPMATKNVNIHEYFLRVVKVLLVFI